MTSEPALRVERVIARLNIGGPAIYTILLTSRLRERGIDTELITGVEAPHEGNMLALAEANGVKPHIIPALGRELSPVRDPAVVFKLYRRFRQTRPHIVDTHTAKAGAVGRTAAWLARVPIRIHTFHGHVFHGYFSPAKTRLFVRLETDLARISTRIVVLGQRQRDEILGLGIGRPEQFEVIPLGLDLTRFYSAEAHAGELRSELGLGPGARVVSIVARLVPIKAHDVFLDAAARIHGQMPETVFAVAGDGPERERLEARTKEMGLDSCVRFLGFREDLPRLYAGSDATVLCSDNEGMPVALIESLASATPAVATDAGETREIIRDGVTGFVVPPGNPEALAGAVVRLLKSGEREAMGLAGREHVRERFSIERLCADIEALYRRLAAERLRPAA